VGGGGGVGEQRNVKFEKKKLHCILLYRTKAGGGGGKGLRLGIFQGGGLKW